MDPDQGKRGDASAKPAAANREGAEGEGKRLVGADRRTVSFRERPASGRPGSPHRYFEKSYDVMTFDDGATADDDGGQQLPPSRGSQVVHRHLNGLCVVTAGDVLERATAGGEVEVSSVHYLVGVRKDVQSARGKLRAKRAKRKRGGNGGEHCFDGTVSPQDPLCRVTLSDGTTVLLNCCVEGTVVELNRRLDRSEATVAGSSNAALEEAATGGQGPALLQKDPLLDGHLAVIMPGRESCLP
ncbi:hypothetical protein ACHAWF_004535 [Thalassiosira exigua]